MRTATSSLPIGSSALPLKLLSPRSSGCGRKRQDGRARRQGKPRVHCKRGTALQGHARRPAPAASDFQIVRLIGADPNWEAGWPICRMQYSVTNSPTARSTMSPRRFSLRPAPQRGRPKGHPTRPCPRSAPACAGVTTLRRLANRRRRQITRATQSIPSFCGRRDRHAPWRRPSADRSGAPRS
jgi:hypothetical protein